MRIISVMLGVLIPLLAIGDQAPAPRPIDGRFAPYSTNREHPWNRLHQALFVREAKEGGRRVHTTDPLLYRGGGAPLRW